MGHKNKRAKVEEEEAAAAAAAAAEAEIPAEAEETPEDKEERRRRKEAIISRGGCPPGQATPGQGPCSRCVTGMPQCQWPGLGST